MPFDERKERFIRSEAWNCWINQNNEHLSPEELTEEKIDKEIDSVGVRWGMTILKKFQKMEWLSLALNGEICHVYIPNAQPQTNITTE